MKYLTTGLSFFFLFSILPLVAQKKQEQPTERYILATVAFWNLENLYDTLNDPHTDDDEFTPEGAKNWYGDRYKKKLSKLSSIIEKMGDEDGPEIMGFSEIENKKVIEDLIATPLLKSRHYDIVHLDSKDRRGIDVALIYKANYFKPLKSGWAAVKDSADSKFITRDILVVTGILNNDTITFMVNHWPSRRGNDSEDKRVLAATVARKQVDSIMNSNSEAKIILMGDFNDAPTDKSIFDVLRGKPEKKITSTADLFNPMYKLYKNGVGTLAYQDSWNLFDQIIMSQALIKNANGKYYYKEESASNFVKKDQVQKEGRYAGYPFRTYSGNNFTNGYSDHFPVFIYLMQKIK